MEKLEQRVSELERRTSILEQQREKDYDIINDQRLNLSTIVIELKNITKSLETVTNNWKEAITRSNARQKEEHELINNRISVLEKAVDKLTNKQENDNDKLEKVIDERTILKDSSNYQKYIFEIIKYIIIAILGFVVAMFLK